MFCFGTCRAQLESLARNWCCRVVYVVCVVAKKSSVAGGECERRKQRSVGSIRSELALSFFLCRGLNRFAILTVCDRQSRHWRRGDCVRPSRSVVVVARACEAAVFCLFFCLFVCFFFVRAARSCGGALLMACAPCSALCARLGAACALLGDVCAARRCVCESWRAQFFFCITHSDTRMYFFGVHIAACCWLVAVSAQVTINAADAAALNETLTGLGCWQSSTCQTQNLSCSSTGVVRCNANGSVTRL